MITKYVFNKDTDLDKDFFYVSSLAPYFKKTDKHFEVMEDCIKNSYNPDIEDWDYISILTKKKYKNGAKLSTHCTFEKYGAPIIVFSNDYTTDEKGDNFYGLHFEVVAYEKGCNIWHIYPLPAGSRTPIATPKIGFGEFVIEGGEMVDMTVEVIGKKIKVTMNGHTIETENEHIPDEFHVGLTACEGVNRFYDFTIDAEEA